MDLRFTEEQSAASELAATILADTCTPEVLRRLEQTNENSDDVSWPRDAWSALAEAGLLGIGLPADVGGGGLGFCEMLTVVEQVARCAAPLPAYATLVTGAAPIAEFGSVDQRRRWLPGVIDGSLLVTGALTGADDASGPVVSATATDRGLVANGTAWYVPFAEAADGVVVTLGLPDGDAVLAVLAMDDERITVEPLAPMTGEPQAIVRFAHVPLADDAILPGSVGGDGAATRAVRDRAIAATCVAQAGTCAGALALTAAYVSSREQFGVKLATLQAVSQRAADAWIDTETVRLTAWTAAWRLAESLDAADELAVAKFFTAEAAQRVVAAAQHLHGGIGMDLDYPIHRYFRWAKEHEHRLGGGTAHLAALGRSLAAPPTVGR